MKRIYKKNKCFFYMEYIIINNIGIAINKDITKIILITNSLSQKT